MQVMCVITLPTYCVQRHASQMSVHARLKRHDMQLVAVINQHVISIAAQCPRQGNEQVTEHQTTDIEKVWPSTSYLQASSS